jgi:hypothetical protein
MKQKLSKIALALPTFPSSILACHAKPKEGHNAGGNETLT